ncbi:MAG: sulfotransferase domain-containing protein [Chloroflexi bacterium]|nr:sulfotransferase domain-containing protein [Chloroflexota bacterium]
MSFLLRKAFKSIADPLGGGDFFRKGFVALNRFGEHARSAMYGAVDPSSTIILAGSGRSGTTWLGNLISTMAKAQPIFEPLAPSRNPIVRDLTGWELPPIDVSYIRAFYLAENDPSESWKAHWADILTGRYRTYWTDADRQSYFPDCYLVKEVWANLMLGFVYWNFQPKIVHLVRHPCAVIASRLLVPWQAGVEDILSQEELVETYLRPWVGLIEKEKDLLGAHAVWWAVENMVASKQLASCPHQFIFYEETVTQPVKIGNQLSEWLGRGEAPLNLERLAQKPSRMTQKGVNSIKTDKVLSQWQAALSIEEQKRILRWAHTLDLNWYGFDPMPNTLGRKKEKE